MSGGPLLVLGARSAGACRRWVAARPAGGTVLQWDGLLEALDPPRELAAVDIHQLVGAEDYVRLEEHCRQWLAGWHRPGGEDRSLWEGSSLGEVFAGYHQVHYLLPLLENALLAQRALAALAPSRLDLGEGVKLFPAVWRLAAAQRGIPVGLLPADPPLALEPEWAPRAPRSPLIRLYRQTRRRLLGLAAAGRARLRGEGGVPAEGGGDPAARLVSCQPRPAAGKDLAPLPWVGGGAGAGISCDGRRPAGRGSSPPPRGGPDLDAGGAGPALAGLAAEWPRAATAYSRGSTSGPSGRLGAGAFTKSCPGWRRVAAARPLYGPGSGPLLSMITGATPGGLAGGRPPGGVRWGVQREYFLTTHWGTYLPGPACDWVLSIGPTSDAWFGMRGVPAERLIQVGDPVRKGIEAEVRAHDPAAVRREFGLGEEPVLLFADGHYRASLGLEWPADYWRNLALLKRVARRLPRARVVVKFHPSDSHWEGADHVQRRVAFLRADQPPNLMLAPLNSDARKWLAVCSAVITDISTLGLEAMALNLPVVYLRTPEEGNNLPASGDGFPAALWARDEDELAAALAGVLADPAGTRARLGPGQGRVIAGVFAPARDPWPVLAALARDRA